MKKASVVFFTIIEMVLSVAMFFSINDLFRRWMADVGTAGTYIPIWTNIKPHLYIIIAIIMAIIALYILIKGGFRTLFGVILIWIGVGVGVYFQPDWYWVSGVLGLIGSIIILVSLAKGHTKDKEKEKIAQAKADERQAKEDARIAVQKAKNDALEHSADATFDEIKKAHEDTE